MSVLSLSLLTSNSSYQNEKQRRKLLSSVSDRNVNIDYHCTDDVMVSFPTPGCSSIMHALNDKSCFFVCVIVHNWQINGNLI